MAPKTKETRTTNELLVSLLLEDAGRSALDSTRGAIDSKELYFQYRLILFRLIPVKDATKLQAKKYSQS